MKQASGAEETRIRIGKQSIRLRLVRHPRAKRLSIRIDAAAGEPVLILPPKTSMRAGLRFVETHADWIADKLRALPKSEPFVPGAVIPYHGTPTLLVHSGKLRDATHHNGQTITTGGDKAQFARRIEDFLRAEARAHTLDRADHYGRLIGKMPSRITMKDTKSRWGSCTPDRALSFSWRLVLAPQQVFDYVIAHECAHMRELNHGPRFWALVKKIDPNYAVHRAWLDQQGATLHAYGRPS